MEILKSRFGERSRFFQYFRFEANTPRENRVAPKYSLTNRADSMLPSKSATRRTLHYLQHSCFAL